MMESSKVNWEGLEKCPRCGTSLDGRGRNVNGPPFLVHEPAVCRDVIIGQCGEALAALAELADASEEYASSDQDMPSHDASEHRFDVVLAAARAVLSSGKT
jgi:hypothetical protein